MWGTISAAISLIIITNIQQLKTDGMKNRVPSLTISSDPEDVQFFSFPNAKKPDDAKLIIIGDTDSVRESGLKKGNPVTILIHGFGPRICLLFPLKLAYLNEGFQNVILVDWTKLSTSSLPAPFSQLSYAAALQNVPKVGARVAEFIKFLKTSQIISGASMVHILGHSLGSHVAGSTGASIKNDYGDKLGRITGLDPAGPCTILLDENRLNKKQAKFVDAVHTDIFSQGSSDPMGHVDFYPNSGIGDKQPGCLSAAGGSSGCAHQYAHIFYMKTIERSTVITACECKEGAVPLIYPLICTPPSKGQCEDPTRFGEYASPMARGLYYVEATEAYPADDCTSNTIVPSS